VGDAFPCPCCGHLTFEEDPGSYAICPVCFWEDDVVQLRWPDLSGGANKPSLIDAQASFARIGASEPRLARRVRPSLPGKPLDVGWRPIDRAVDRFEPTGVQEAPWPDDCTVLYWWRPTFWRPG
jgi:Cysteine-rich CPCC